MWSLGVRDPLPSVKETCSHITSGQVCLPEELGGRGGFKFCSRTTGRAHTQPPSVPDHLQAPQLAGRSFVHVASDKRPVLGQPSGEGWAWGGETHTQSWPRRLGHAGPGPRLTPSGREALLLATLNMGHQGWGWPLSRQPPAPLQGAHSERGRAEPTGAETLWPGLSARPGVAGPRGLLTAWCSDTQPPALRGPAPLGLAMAGASSGSKLRTKLNLLCAELWVVLGCGLASPSAQTRRPHSAAGFAERHGAWGCAGRPASGFSLSGLEPNQHRGPKHRHLGADLEGNPPSLLCFPPKIQLSPSDTPSPAGPRRPPCLPSQVPAWT